MSTFVSLGSTCEIAHVLRECGLRNASYPLDWITTIDTSGFLKLFQENFKHFLDKSCLTPVRKDPYPLLNEHHKIEFLHDGRFNDESFANSMTDFQSKYQRRIERFRNLNNPSPLHVVFLRHAYKYSTSDPHRVYYCQDNLKIDDDQSMETYHTLQKFFPDLPFTLIIVNNHDISDIILEKQMINDGLSGCKLIKIHANPGLDLKTKSELYLRFFRENGFILPQSIS